MIQVNACYDQVRSTYLFYRVTQSTEAWQRVHPGVPLLLLGVGDVSLPLAPAVIRAMRAAVEELAHKETFQGYMPELGKEFLKEAVVRYYGRLGVSLDPAEVFISPGAGDDLGAIGNLFARENTVAVAEPAYPAYVDTSLMAGRSLLHLPGTRNNGFLPLPEASLEADLVYLCSPNNPTGAAYTSVPLSLKMA